MGTSSLGTQQWLPLTEPACVCIPQIYTSDKSPHRRLVLPRAALTRSNKPTQSVERCPRRRILELGSRVTRPPRPCSLGFSGSAPSSFSRPSTAFPSVSATLWRSPAPPPPPNRKCSFRYQPDSRTHASAVISSFFFLPMIPSLLFAQAAVHCILPKEWKGIRFGGLERIVIYFDLDCRFDVHRLNQILKHRIREVLGKHCLDFCVCLPDVQLYKSCFIQSNGVSSTYCNILVTSRQSSCNCLVGQAASYMCNICRFQLYGTLVQSLESFGVDDAFTVSENSITRSIHTQILVLKIVAQKNAYDLGLSCVGTS